MVRISCQGYWREKIGKKIERFHVTKRTEISHLFTRKWNRTRALTVCTHCLLWTRFSGKQSESIPTAVWSNESNSQTVNTLTKQLDPDLVSKVGHKGYKKVTKDTARSQRKVNIQLICTIDIDWVWNSVEVQNDSIIL